MKSSILPYKLIKENKRPLWPQLLILAGVFLLPNIFIAQPVSALSSSFDVKEPQMSIVEKNKEQLSNLDKSFKTEQEKLDEKIDTLNKVKAEADEAAKTKESLQSQVSDIKNDVEELKAKVAEKKRLDAERTVTVTTYASDSVGNSYALGNCTWYAKSKRPDLPNNLGNANTWYVNAAADGFKVGSMAKKGAIGVTTDGALGHVVYVEKWLGDGKILISEMNYGGLYNMNTREANESDFVYIYAL